MTVALMSHHPANMSGYKHTSDLDEVSRYCFPASSLNAIFLCCSSHVFPSLSVLSCKTLGSRTLPKGHIPGHTQWSFSLPGDLSVHPANSTRIQWRQTRAGFCQQMNLENSSVSATCHSKYTRTHIRLNSQPGIPWTCHFEPGVLSMDMDTTGRIITDHFLGHGCSGLRTWRAHLFELLTGPLKEPWTHQPWICFICN